HLFRPSRMNVIIKILGGLRTPEIVYDGIEDGTYTGKKLENNDRICIQNNKTFEGEDVTYANLHLDNQRKGYPYPGGPATTDLEPHNCKFDPFPAVVLENPAVPSSPAPAYSDDEIAKKCTTKTAGVNWGAVEVNCPQLSNYNLFKSPTEPTREPSSEGFEYKLNNELFTDYAEKNRFIFLPPKQKIQYTAEGVLDFPAGTIISKTFSFYLNENGKGMLTPIETRLLIKRKAGWDTLDYIWNLPKHEAFLVLGGEVRTLKILAHNQNPMEINYGIPNKRQCASCHVSDVSTRGLLNPIGPKAKFLNWDVTDTSTGQMKNQLVLWSEKGYLAQLPADIKSVPQVAKWDLESSGTLDQRAKAYLEVNCAHCHNPKGPAANTALYLLTSVATESPNYGHCKPPTAAGFASGGRSFDVTPGKADESILLYRLQQSHLAVRMPQLGRTVAHTEANELIKQWINAQTGSCK
ncbi:MAG: SO2930 family diheme c-type cytochrome, partial [Pseudobdellovibrio sp.]